jgi:LPS export ABC transporter protein LptC
MINRFLFSIYLKAAIFCSCFFILGCENDERTLNAWTEKKVMVDEVREVTTLFSQRGNLKAILKSPLMLRYQTDTNYVEFPKKLHVDFYDSLAKRESWLDAKYGKYFESLNRVFLRDSVKVITIGGDTLYTAELWWDQAQQQFFTDSVVKIITKDNNVRGGKGMVASQDLDNVVIRNPTGTMIMRNGMPGQ